MAKQDEDDLRPPVAVGHVRIQVHNVPETIDGFESLGLRRIFRNERYGVLELRGGTHLIVSQRERPIRKGTKAPFDLMVDDVHAARAEYSAKGIDSTEITSGSIHSSFHVRLPSGHRLKITSSHSGTRPV